MSDQITTERLYVENFAGIDKAEIELSRMNVFIGPQATGKSVCAKLFYYFRDIIRSIPYPFEQTKSQIKAAHKTSFIRYFPSRGSVGEFSVAYSCGDISIEVRRIRESSPAIEIAYSKYYDDLIKRVRRDANKTRMEKANSLAPNVAILSTIDADWRELEHISPLLTNDIYFIPAGRSFFSVIQGNVFTLITNDAYFDPFIAQFGRYYERSRKQFLSGSGMHPVVRSGSDRRIARLLAGRYFRENGVDFIRSPDGRQTPLLYSSSGQQEVLPIAIFVSILMDTTSGSNKSTLVIEEPETHLYPAAQREIVHFLTSAIDLQADDSASQCIQTTHSPYILSALNNLMYGGKIVAESPGKRARVEAVLGDTSLLDPGKVRAYYFDNGTCRSIIDPETGLIEAKALDQVSNELAREFEDLMNIEFEDKKVA